MALSVLDFEHRERPETDWIIPNLLTRQNTAFVMGPPKKACKSWLLLAMAMDLGEGRAPWTLETLRPARAMRTVYFTQEDTTEDIGLRIDAHLGGGARPNDRVWVVPKNLAIKLDTHEGRRIMQRELDEVVERAGAIDLVMFDPMRRIHNGNENDSDTIAKMWDVIDKVHRRYNCAVIISHHITKPPRDKAGYDASDPFNGRGSGDIYGGGDAFMVVVPGVMAKDKTWRRVEVYFESKRAQELEKKGLTVHFDSGKVEEMLPLISISPRERDIYTQEVKDGVDLRTV